MGTAHIRLLGAVRFVTDRGEVVDLPSAAQRRLLAALAVAGGTTQRTEHLSDTLELSTGSLRTTVSRLRSRIGDDLIQTDTTGYRVTCAVDATMFTDLLVERPDDPDRLAALERGARPVARRRRSTSSATNRGPHRRSPASTSSGRSPSRIERRC